MQALLHPASRPAIMEPSRSSHRVRGPAPPAADKMCRDVVSAPKDRPVVQGSATVRFLGAGGAAIEVECAKVSVMERLVCMCVCGAGGGWPAGAARGELG